MNIDWNTNLYGLIGNPISKSLSPKIHNYFFRVNKINSVYLAFNIKEKDLGKALKSLKLLNIKGFNVTVPHKIKIMDYMDEVTKEAEILGAVNTVINISGKLIGDNTDGKGFIESLKQEGIKLEGKNILIIGAGGAAHAISLSLAMNGVNKIYILNRSIDNALFLKERLETRFKDLIVDYDTIENFNLDISDIDIVINCTSVGMYPQIQSTPINLEGFKKSVIICDIVYKPLKTKMLKNAEKLGFKTIDGLGMLVNQAILSQKSWCNISEKNVEKNVKEIKGFLLKK